MRTFKSHVFSCLAAVVLVCLLAACGDSTRNDQGVSFTLIGWFHTSSCTTGWTGAILPISTDAEVAGATGTIIAAAGVENHLQGQFIRVEQIHHSYEIPGATAQPPTTLVPLTILLGPPPSIDAPESTLPDSFAQASLSCAETLVVPPQIMTWMNLNREHLPEMPFNLVVNSYATGVTSAGHSVESNSVEVFVLISPDNIIPPRDGSAGSSLESEGVVDDAGEEIIEEEADSV